MNLFIVVHSDNYHSARHAYSGEKKLTDDHENAHDENEPAKAFLEVGRTDLIGEMTADKEATGRKCSKGEKQYPIEAEMIQAEQESKQGIDGNDEQ